MEISVLHTRCRVRSHDPIELLAVVDGSTVRAAIDWSTLEHLIGANLLDEQAVHHFVRIHRTALDLAIKAHLFAHGVPLTRTFVLTTDEIEYVHPNP